MSEDLKRIESIKESAPDIFAACDLGLLDTLTNLCSTQKIKFDDINNVCQLLQK